MANDAKNSDLFEAVWLDLGAFNKREWALVFWIVNSQLVSIIPNQPFDVRHTAEPGWYRINREKFNTTTAGLHGGSEQGDVLF